MVRWHRAGWRLFWRYRSRPGRPPIPLELRQLIRRIAAENPLWGEERIANELLVKLGVRVSPRTVGKYMPKRPPGQPRGDQRWSTFLKNHATAILACDFFVAVTATFRMLYVFVIIEHGTRRLAHINVTTNPTADWTLQQLREVVRNGGGHRYLIHDRDRIFAKRLDDSIRALGVEILRSPVASPKANAIAERVIGTARRECLDWLIPMSEAHLRAILKCWATHYNRGRPHSALGPGVPDPPQDQEVIPKPETRHRLAADVLVLEKSVLEAYITSIRLGQHRPDRVFAHDGGRWDDGRWGARANGCFSVLQPPLRGALTVKCGSGPGVGLDEPEGHGRRTCGYGHFGPHSNRTHRTLKFCTRYVSGGKCGGNFSRRLVPSPAM